MAGVRMALSVCRVKLRGLALSVCKVKLRGLALSVCKVKLRENDTLEVEAVNVEEVEAETAEVMSVPPWYILADDAPRPSAKAGTEPTCFGVGFAVDRLLDVITVPIADEDSPAVAA